MDATIGQFVGNSLEVIESLETLKGRGPDNLMELVTTLGKDATQTPRSSRNSVDSRVLLCSLKKNNKKYKTIIIFILISNTDFVLIVKFQLSLRDQLLFYFATTTLIIMTWYLNIIVSITRLINYNSLNINLNIIKLTSIYNDFGCKCN